jgi:hypothetical protein
VPASSVPLAEPGKEDRISIPERIGATLLLVTSLVIGLFPGLLLDLILPALQTELMTNVLRGVSR